MKATSFKSKVVKWEHYLKRPKSFEKLPQDHSLKQAPLQQTEIHVISNPVIQINVLDDIPIKVTSNAQLISHHMHHRANMLCKITLLFNYVLWLNQRLNQI
ncbi:hypothetical protein ACF0H5_002996 [Mactra antiquata]